MTVREALETRPWFRRLGVVKGWRDAATEDFERALRASYDCGFRDRCVSDPCDNRNGVTAGVAAMMEES